MLPSFLGIVAQGGGGPPPPPPYGTLLSSHCSGYSAQDAGAENYTDFANGIWNGMFTTWQELADGVGGSFWSNLGNNTSDIYSSCWYPYGYIYAFSLTGTASAGFDDNGDDIYYSLYQGTVSDGAGSTTVLNPLSLPYGTHIGNDWPSGQPVNGVYVNVYSDGVGGWYLAP